MRLRDGIEPDDDEVVEHLDADGCDGLNEERKDEFDLDGPDSESAVMFNGSGGTGGTASMGVGGGAGEHLREIDHA